jgi:hypothetical protein
MSAMRAPLGRSFVLPWASYPVPAWEIGIAQPQAINDGMLYVQSDATYQV